MKHILPIIVIAQFLSTSLWFAGNAVLPDMAAELDLAPAFLGNLTSAVQLGFITGTLLFAILTVADKFSPSKVFLLSALLAALFNLAISMKGLNGIQILLLRFGTGFFLAGIYPVGMKIASDYFQKGLGKSLGLLVGALVLGTAFPHLVRSMTEALPWRFVLHATSALSVFGGFLIWIAVPNGPYRKPSQAFDFTVFFKVFQIKSFRSAALGYFGHMWELYAFWAFLPVFIQQYGRLYGHELNISFTSFAIIGLGGLSCAMGGYLSEKFHPSQIAKFALSTSGICCFLSPLIFTQPFSLIFLLFLMVWGLAITADSPMFSTLVAQNAPEQNRGTALTIVNSLGFGISILSIQLLNILNPLLDPSFLFLILGMGPVIGLFYFVRGISIKAIPKN
ncbi:MFS transporter [Cecembia calidifontis]|uniref:Putative MFS family arabinose efflux permease n=1 Tax=Cecembia calidifontis TaxID=1187080 RepID=A0A4Q7PC64_9BACT|nr:MFS transporter [Cecembia calidifontis]RZS97288.1 putative MFS family arabinose efflux permease [Cecembia calidifontis]